MMSEHFSTVIYTSDQICHCPHTAKGFCLKVIETYISLPSHKYFKVSFKDLKRNPTQFRHLIRTEISKGL